MTKEKYGYDSVSRLRDVVVRRGEDHGLNFDEIDEAIIIGSGSGAIPEENMNIEKAGEPSGPIILTYEDVLKEAGIIGWSDQVRAFLYILFGRDSGENDTGHKKRLIIGPIVGLGDKPLIVQDGREHLYEGTDPKRAIIWLRLMQLLGVQTIIGSNAAGILTPNTLKEPSIMLINDFLEVNCGDNNPLKGKNESECGVRFPSVTAMYNVAFHEKILDLAREICGSVTDGIYFRAPGPNYETVATVLDMRARLENFWRQGQQQNGLNEWFQGQARGVVGMSTVYELLTIFHAMQSKKHPAFQNLILFFSVLTNYAASLGPNGFVAQLDGEEVQRKANQMKVELLNIIKKILVESRNGNISRMVPVQN
ncbi:MAG: purine nucleoside phosphorylase, purine-nucleoside phosphorylase [Candidatus Peregrinibacteria bacterium GW2011_GWF2_33_10]|nr:MAG: purine nucleoside phosphorylase, purine-nucleoside phosphorylase [Candidatus Peregrinibacteria bacterium GW2011_GWF2_33_10]OGJ45444.1 MAG: hypothetical protein A2263_04220 [Candidatus Peregrinibacteria bacterium RIFOXYA2_FULL_33_21]OGJ46274.1 MAG: hypothetical protein A2272_02985 [Candidatus Peregrinibacteria bacterium RIFOXYA12_FULL_33_12]OGJ51048.1 MAG: hypothetical protein A2307_05820 [Candidatus Peregrinibacteria bacterium RIFOXYB2_FULL_33_20]